MVGIENLGENLKSINKEMDYWRNPEVQEADMELQNLLDEPEIPEPTSKGSTENPLGNQSQILAQRPNVPLVSGLGNIPTGVALTDEQRQTMANAEL